MWKGFLPLLNLPHFEIKNEFGGFDFAGGYRQNY